MATPTNLPASFVSGAVLTAAQQNDLRGAFRVLQVATAVTTTQQSSTSATFVDCTGQSVTITPQAATNKILLISTNSLIASVFNANVNIRFLRNATTVYTAIAGFIAADSGGNFTSIQIDSPNTTSAVTYKVQFARAAGTGTVFSNLSGAASTFLVMEISA